MKLTPEQQSSFEAWLRQKIEHASCTLCQANRWKIGGLVGTHTIDAIDDQIDKEQSAMLQLICKNCGHVLMFDTRYIAGWQDQQDLSKSGLIM
ncbi:MAG: hypothetical protein JSS27_10600 [Planctomycetes bacterium]|nr:hypothetical protein [Planctomycetota bacterium]